MPHLVSRLALAAFLAAMSSASLAQTPVANPDADKEDWQVLFNGKDLTGWTPKIAKHDFGDNVPFTNDLDDLVAYRHDYDRLMLFWKERHPSFVWQQDYEALVADPEPRIRALLDHCGLAFDERCLRFHEAERDVRTMSAAQVRAPLRNDTARTHRYGNHLDPLRRALAHRDAGTPA